MKFGAQFEANIVAEWAEHYCRYKHLKHLIGRLFPQKLKKKNKGDKDKKKKDKNKNGTALGSSYGSGDDRKRTSGDHDSALDENYEHPHGEEKGEPNSGTNGNNEEDNEGDDGGGRAEYIINYQSDDIADRATCTYTITNHTHYHCLIHSHYVPSMPI